MSYRAVYIISSPHRCFSDSELTLCGKMTKVCWPCIYWLTSHK